MVAGRCGLQSSGQVNRNGADFLYGVLFLDGTQTYRVTGQVRDSELLLAQLNSAIPGVPGSKHLRNYDFADFHVESDGAIEITLSATEQKGNWIRLDSQSRYQFLQFRPTAETWDECRPIYMWIGWEASLRRNMPWKKSIQRPWRAGSIWPAISSAI
jgi:hypothetical protein